MNYFIRPFKRETLMRKSTLLLIATNLILSNNIFANSQIPEPITDGDYYEVESEAVVKLGQMLFFDKALSGNYNTSCATCHHPMTYTGDGLSLPIGEGGRGLGMIRNTGTGSERVHERVPRNSPPIFNLGAKEFNKMFHDGRVFKNHNLPSGFQSPANDQLPAGLNNVLAVQAMFPVTSGTEMAGQLGENEIADAAANNRLSGESGVWGLLAERLRNIPDYVALFTQAYPQKINSAQDIQFVDAENAIAAFEATALRSDNSPFDQYLRGDQKILSQSQRNGMRLFYGKADCAACHSGKFQTDQSFHSIAMPQIGPGKGDNSESYYDGLEDFGLERVSGHRYDRFKFRTPSLRNVALTAPYGHAGAYNDLESIVRHHLNPIDQLHNYDMSQAALPYRVDLNEKDFVIMNDPLRKNEISNSNELSPTILSEQEIDDLISFLHALTDKSDFDMRADVPNSVPSGASLTE